MELCIKSVTDIISGAVQLAKSMSEQRVWEQTDIVFAYGLPLKAVSDGAIDKVLAQAMRPRTRTKAIKSYGIGHLPDALHKAMAVVDVQHCP